MSEYCMYCMNPITEEVCGYCGKKVNTYKPAPHHLMYGSILNNRYIVGSVLGEGGFGITYIGRDMNLDIRVAIKEYFPSGVVNRNNTSSTDITALVGDAQTGFEKGKKSFLAEARTLAMFSSESSVVSVQDFFSENNTVYIVMEYLEGNDLKEYIAQNGMMSFQEAFTLLSPVMTALTKIHKQGLIHRDISPTNIMILKDGTVKLLDFGAARNVGGADEKSLSIMLKPGFAPEEQYRSKGHQGPWTDVYALSATMYKLITGITPDDAMNRLFSDETKKPSEINSSVSNVQDAVIQKGMAIQQSERFQTIDELQSACENSLYAINKTVTSQNEEDSTLTGEQYFERTEPKHESKEKIDKDSWTIGLTNEKSKQGQKQNNSLKSAGVNTSVNQKKPNTLCFICSTVTGLLSLYSLLSIASVTADGNKTGGIILYALLTIVFAGISVFTGRYYYSCIDNKNRRPNIPCFIASILSSFATVFSLFSAFIDNDESLSAFGVLLTVVLLSITAFFGYFYYPRLERKTRKKFIKVYSGMALAVIVAFIGVIIYLSLNTITIGDNNFKRNAESVSLHLDIINDNDLAKLKELKSLKSLEIIECFLDDEDVKTIGEMTQLEKLSLNANTDISDVSPLSNLTELTYLNISNTGVKNISDLSDLKKLNSLSIDNTNISDLSTLSGYSELETLNMSNLTKLTLSTISLPSGLLNINCSNNNIEDISFLSVTANTLYTLSASNNKISDISILSSFKCLSTLELASNNITDISSLPNSPLGSLNLCNNHITDISVLEEYKNGPYTLNLSYNQITDISALNENSGIGLVELNNNLITDISALKDCFNIYSLDISNNEIADISALQTIDKLGVLSLANNKVSDITSLAYCSELHDSECDIDLSNNNISDIKAIEGFKTKGIHISNNKISDISALSSCANLEAIYANHNKISDIYPTVTLTKLNTLEIVDNPISSLGKLSLNAEDSLLDLSTLRLSYSEQIDWEELAKSEKTSVTIYDVTDRQKAQLQEYGFKLFSTTEELDKADEKKVESVDDANPETVGESNG